MGHAAASRYRHRLPLRGNVTYQIVQPPFNLRFRNMPVEDLKEYFAWFQSVLQCRIDELAAYVQKDAASKNWEPDGSPDSLEMLGGWLEKYVSTRERTQEEKDEIEARLGDLIAIPSHDLTNESYSLGFDIGIYFGLTLLKNHPTLRWSQNLRNKNFADYGQPVIVGFEAVPLNPVRIGLNFAYGFARKRISSGRIHEVYETWSTQVQ